MRLVSTFSILSVLLLFIGCFGKNSAPVEEKTIEIADEQDRTLQEKAAQNRTMRDKATRIAATLDDRQLAAQVIISGIDGKGHLTKDMEFLLTECPAGGIILFRYNLDTDNDSIQSLTAETAALIESGSSVPPFVAVDHEGGIVNRFRRGVADLPAAASYAEAETAIARITADSFSAGKMLNNLGINLNLAPVAEYLNEDNRVFLDDRSYSSDPVFTAAAATAFIAGMEQAGILCVAKHFPGSAGADPHYFPSVLKGDKAALTELIYPMAALIRSGHARAIMISHSTVPALDNNIASLSPVIMGEWLRQELGFEGIIISDDFSMASASNAVSAGDKNLKPETAAVLSLAAGADMVLVWPPDLRRTHRAIAAALADDNAPPNGGGVFHERLREAAGRIIFEKIQIGLINEERAVFDEE